MTLRVVAALRPGLWADEIFSLAMATGHSLEHPPAVTDPSVGDFVEPRQPGSSSFFSRYTEHEEPPAGIRRVLRAVLLSDTSPPLYYLLLNYWSPPELLEPWLRDRGFCTTSLFSVLGFTLVAPAVAPRPGGRWQDHSISGVPAALLLSGRFVLLV
jgi:hypothetical protein